MDHIFSQQVCGIVRAIATVYYVMGMYHWTLKHSAVTFIRFPKYESILAQQQAQPPLFWWV